MCKDCGSEESPANKQAVMIDEILRLRRSALNPPLRIPDSNTTMTVDRGLLRQAELIAHTFHSGDIILPDLFTHLADVNVYRAGENVYIGAPDIL